MTAEQAAPATVKVLGGERMLPAGVLLDEVGRCRPALPFADERVEFLADFARRLGKRARGDGGAQSLAFWLRRADLHRMRGEYAAMDDPALRMLPRGTVLHFPPANVDSIFVYSMAISMLTGNRNIVRMSARVLSQPNLILNTVLETLPDHPEVAQTTALITYGHDDAVTSQLSAGCDVRVIWGGDATVASIRRWPLPPHGRDLTFPDRFSMAAIGVEAFMGLDDGERDGLVERFYNDTFWFDQMGCSSPRTMLWVGGGDFEAAAADFHKRLASVAVRKGYDPDAALAVAKLAYSYRAVIDTGVSQYRRYGNADTVLNSDGFIAARGEFCGGGVLYQTHVEHLADIATHITRTDQTLTVFGIDRAEIDELVTLLAGAGIDRIVPVGKALDFSRYWDGYDLLREFTRLVSVEF